MELFSINSWSRRLVERGYNPLIDLDLQYADELCGHLPG